MTWRETCPFFAWTLDNLSFNYCVTHQFFFPPPNDFSLLICMIDYHLYSSFSLSLLSPNCSVCLFLPLPFELSSLWDLFRPGGWYHFWRWKTLSFLVFGRKIHFPLRSARSIFYEKTGFQSINAIISVFRGRVYSSSCYSFFFAYVW